MILTAIPSPPQSVWYLGPLPLRAYALCILTGIVVAVLVAQRRLAARGGPPERVVEVAFWAVPFGIVGGRLYHVVTSPQPYFGEGGDPWKVVALWEGGLGIWGAIALGAVGAAIGCRRQNIRFSVFADVLAPGLLLAQAVGRLGNWFNQELFGAPTTLPWGLRIDAAHMPAGDPPGTLYHPTFLYEMLWCLAGAVLLLRLDRRFRFGHGRAFWLFVMIYTSGRLWIESLRIDPANRILGLRLNVWTSVLVFLLALVAFLLAARRHPGREASVLVRPEGPDEEDGETAPRDDVGSEPETEGGSSVKDPDDKVR